MSTNTAVDFKCIISKGASIFFNEDTFLLIRNTKVIQEYKIYTLLLTLFSVIRKNQNNFHKYLILLVTYMMQIIFFHH